MTTVLAARSPSRWPCRLQYENRAAEQIGERKQVDRAEEISNDDLAELKLEAGGVDDPQAHDPLAPRLPAPVPFGEDAVADRNDEVGDDGNPLGEIGTENGQQRGDNAEQRADCADWPRGRCTGRGSGVNRPATRRFEHDTLKASARRASCDHADSVSWRPLPRVVLIAPAGKGEVGKEADELEQAEGDFDAVGQYRLVVLREECLDGAAQTSMRLNPPMSVTEIGAAPSPSPLAQRQAARVNPAARRRE